MGWLLFGWILALLLLKQWLFIILFLGIIIYFLIKKKNKVVFWLLLGGIVGIITTLDFFPYVEELDQSIGIIYERKENYYLVLVENNCYYVNSPNHSYEIGDIIKIDGTISNLSFSTLEGQFNFEEYLYNKNVEREIKITRLEFVFKNPFRLDVYIDNYLSEQGEYTSKLIGMLLFQRSDYQLNDSFYTLKIGYLFSLSGIQIYFLFNFFKKIILFFTNKVKLSSRIALILLVPLMVLSYFRLAFLKAFIILLFCEVKTKKVERSSVNNIILIILLILNNRYIFTTSFLYMFVLPFVYRYTLQAVNSFKEKYRKVVRNFYLFQIASIIDSYISGEYYLFGFIIIPIGMLFSKIFLILGVFSLMFPLQFILEPLSKWFIELIEFLYSFAHISSFEEQNILLLLVLVILFFLQIYWTEIHLYKLATFKFISSVIVICLVSSPLSGYFSSYISFINVGQGDCTLIHKNNTNILIDVGGSIYLDIAKDVLIPYFEKRHIEKIDVIFITHEDYDHNGALESLKQLIEIGEIIIGSNFYQKEINNIMFYNLNQYQKGTENNDNSSVLYFYFINKYFLLMGDASISIEKRIIEDYKNLKCDILKVGHHGSQTSSSYQFLKHLSPSEAIISVGKGNYYHHPSSSVIISLKNLKIKIRRTDIEGTIQYRQFSLPF